MTYAAKGAAIVSAASKENREKRIAVFMLAVCNCDMYRTRVEVSRMADAL